MRISGNLVECLYLLFHSNSSSNVPEISNKSGINANLSEYQNLQMKSTHEGLEKFGILPFNPETLLFSLTSPVPSSLSFFSFSPRTHTVLLSVQSTKRGQRGSMSVRQVVTQMMTNWPPLCSPPNQVQTWLSCTHSFCKWRSIALRWRSQSLSSVTHSQRSVSAI